MFISVLFFKRAGGVIAAFLLAALMLAPAHATPASNALNGEAIDVNRGFADLVAAVKPAVVNIAVTGETPAREFRGPPEMEEFFRRFFGESPLQRGPRAHKFQSAGSGFIISAGGLVVTNHHVIEHAEKIEVVLDDGKRLPATLRGGDEKTDLALLQIESETQLPYLRFGDSEAARIGDWVIAIGNPFGLGGTTTKGIISARGRDINAGPLDDFIQIDAPINRGNSGGPLFNTKGEVIGVNSAIYSPNGGNVGIGFAIPAAMAAPVIAQLRASGEVKRGFLGVTLQHIDEKMREGLGLDAARGGLVADVVKDGPADKAGIQVGDVILRYDGKAVKKMRDLPKLVALTKSGSKVKIVVWREQKEKTLRVVIGGDKPGETVEAQDADVLDALGLQLDNTEDGVLVVSVEESARREGLRPGDVIKRIGARKVQSTADVRAVVADLKKSEKQTALLLVENRNGQRFVALSLAS